MKCIIALKTYSTDYNTCPSDLNGFCNGFVNSKYLIIR